MITVNLKGRLGNQLFIYAFARRLSELFPNEKIYLIKGKEYENSGVLLENYSLNSQIELIDSAKYPLLKKIGGFIYAKFFYTQDFERLYKNEKFYNKTIGKIFSLFYLQNGYADFNINSNTHCNGFFQSEKFFPTDLTSLKKELTPKHDVLPENALLMERVKNDENSVCVDIRLGDYMNHPIHGVCKTDYYLSAMKVMKEKLGNPTFYIFSDEIDKLKEIFPDEYNIVFESGIDKDYEKLRIMSNCKHFIISNSSYSWWAQYLCENKDKIVIAPNRWFKVNMPCDIYQENWVLLEV